MTRPSGSSEWPMAGGFGVGDKNNHSAALDNVTDSDHHRHRGEGVNYPFHSPQQAINFVQKNIPGRQRFPNFFELERSSRPYLPDFHPNQSERIWSRVLKSIQRVLLKHHRDARRAWMLCNLGDRSLPESKNPLEQKRMRALAERRGERTQIHPRDAAKEFRVSPRTIYRWFDRINEDLEAEFSRRKLIPPPAEYGRQEAQGTKD